MREVQRLSVRELTCEELEKVTGGMITVDGNTGNKDKPEGGATGDWGPMGGASGGW